MHVRRSVFMCRVVTKQYSGNATHTSDIDTATDRDRRAILERNAALLATGGDGAGAGADHPGAAVGYRGLTGYALLYTVYLML